MQMARRIASIMGMDGRFADATSVDDLRFSALEILLGCSCRSLLTYLLAYLLAYLLTYLLAYLLTCLSTSIGLLGDSFSY
jgi:hypothetical protein